MPIVPEELRTEIIDVGAQTRTLGALADTFSDASPGVTPSKLAKATVAEMIAARIPGRVR